MNRRDEARYMGKVEEMFREMNGDLATPEEPEEEISPQGLIDGFLEAVNYLKNGLELAGFQEEGNQVLLICTFFETQGG